MIPAMALIIPIVAVGGFFLWMISLSPVGKAYAEKLRGKTAQSAGTGDNEHVLEELELLRHEVAELSERMDFAERMLAKGREQRQGLPS